MPELPDITIYLEALEKRIFHGRLQRVQLASPFLLRTAAPPISAVEGKEVVALQRLGKRICVGFEGSLWMVLHLMIAGRLHWKEFVTTGRVSEREKKSPLKFPKNTLAIFHFENGQLSLTEAGTQRRASLHIVQGEEGLRGLDPGGIELFRKKPGDKGGGGHFIDLANFARVLKSENHTLKRALTDPRLFSGVGNAYSDEILWHARLSPVKLTQKLTEEEITRLHNATRDTLMEWIERLRQETGERFPEKVTAFRKEMATHGRYREPCPRCGTKIQRIRYASNETNYCPGCQTGGRLLADRALSRLLREDWPKRAEDMN
ncbi:MAG TPA: DNA-formamidopyrimidine glycosylase family protein [Pyrinomonadaceae bacterium]|nr:DNA-formamidopyrimidine glycosylase family protein [Pyrinomonadaceae bacterium]